MLRTIPKSGQTVRKRRLKHSADWLGSRDSFCARSLFEICGRGRFSSIRTSSAKYREQNEEEFLLQYYCRCHTGRLSVPDGSRACRSKGLRILPTGLFVRHVILRLRQHGAVRRHDFRSRRELHPQSLPGRGERFLRSRSEALRPQTSLTRGLTASENFRIKITECDCRDSKQVFVQPDFHLVEIKCHLAPIESSFLLTDHISMRRAKRSGSMLTSSGLSQNSRAEARLCELSTTRPSSRIRSISSIRPLVDWLLPFL